MRELVGDAGTIVPARDPDLLAEAMLGLMGQPPEDRSAQGRAARERIARDFNIDDRADAWEKLYRTVLQGER
jgi:glycosyltransferase involved in cell wall biosynthesis